MAARAIVDLQGDENRCDQSQELPRDLMECNGTGGWALTVANAMVQSSHPTLRMILFRVYSLAASILMPRAASTQLRASIPGPLSTCGGSGPLGAAIAMTQRGYQ